MKPATPWTTARIGSHPSIFDGPAGGTAVSIHGLLPRSPGPNSLWPSTLTCQAVEAREGETPDPRPWFLGIFCPGIHHVRR